MAADLNIEQILNGDIDYDSILSAALFIKMAASINGLNGVVGNIRSQRFSTSSVWTSPEDEACWVIAIGVGGGGGGGGGKINFPAPATAGSGGNGGDTYFGTELIATGGAGGTGAFVGGIFGHSTEPYTPNNFYDFLKFGTNYGRGGRGGFLNTKPIYITGKAGAPYGDGGQSSTYSIKLIKDVAPGTAYPITIGAGGAAGAAESGTPFPNETMENATNGIGGAMEIFYSGV